MTLVKRNYNPWNNLFEDVLGSLNNPGFQKDLQVPAVNIIENKDSFQLEVSAPGLQKQDFKLKVDDNLLTISFEKANEEAAEDQKVHRQEFTKKSFKRTFTLDEKINAEDISAKYESGILLVTLPKKEEVKVEAKSIEIL